MRSSGCVSDNEYILCVVTSVSESTPTDLVAGLVMHAVMVFNSVPASYSATACVSATEWEEGWSQKKVGASALRSKGAKGQIHSLTHMERKTNLVNSFHFPN